MFVCLCKVITDREIEEAVRNGATTISEVGEYCEAGTDCGGCHEQLQDIIDRAEAKQPNAIVLSCLCR